MPRLIRRSPVSEAVYPLSRQGTPVFPALRSDKDKSAFGKRFGHASSRSVLAANCPADGFAAREELGSGELEKRCEAKCLFCLLLSGKHCASAISYCSWAKYWRFSVPWARDFFTCCWKRVQVSALPWQACSTPKGESYVKIRSPKELENWTWMIAESKHRDFPERRTVGEQLVCSGRRGKEIKDEEV